MSAADVVQAWIAERDAALEADGKGLDHSPGPSIAAGSWNGSATEPADLRREAQVLRFLQRAMAEGSEVEDAMRAIDVAQLAQARAKVIDWANGQPADDVLAELQAVLFPEPRTS